MTASYQSKPVPFGSVHRRKGERMEAFEERKRAERHRLHMQDMETVRRVNAHAVLTMDAVCSAIFGGAGPMTPHFIVTPAGIRRAPTWAEYGRMIERLVIPPAPKLVALPKPTGRAAG